MTDQSLENARYLNLGTFRKSGVRVDTPVWFAEYNGALYVLSNNQAGKVKRLRNSGRCVIAPCTFIGTATGAWQETEAMLIHAEAEIAAAHAALKKKYGWQMLLLDGGARLGGRIQERSYIRIRQPH
jgi:PPOX class probable F420-dependent enzyme